MEKKTLFIALALFCSLQSYSQETVLKDTLGLDKSYCPSPAKILQGRLSGVMVTPPAENVNENYSVIIRGLNSIRNDSQPLWVVDGMPLGSSYLSFLNPYDIESIEVLKDISATAAYGPAGANGVILVSTRRVDKADGTKVEWNSNFSLSMPFNPGATTRNAFSHNHSIVAVHTKGQSALRFSGQFTGLGGVAVNNSGNTGKFMVSYETKANSIVWFGTNTFFSIGGASSPTDVATEYGSPSIFLAERAPGGNYGTVEGWKNDFDNDSKLYHLVNSTYLQVNFLKEFNFNVNLGVDYYDLNRYIWYGNGTPLGKDMNGYADITSTSRLRLNAVPEFRWNRYFGDHHVYVSAGAEVLSDMDKYNDMYGWDFFSHELRAKGLNINASRTDINNWSNNYFRAGATAKAKYAYKDIVGTNLSFRADWTPRYDDSTPVFYYSADAFVKVCKGVRLTGGYGVSGDERYVPSCRFDDYLAGSYPEIEPSVAFYYEGLSRTTTREWNAGASFDLLSGRLTGGVKYFRGHTDDSFNAWCFGRKMEDSYMWKYCDRKDFFGRNCAFTRSGVEVDIDAVPVKTSNVEWSIGANFTWADNVVTEVSDQDVFGISPGNEILTSANVVGFPAASIVGYQTDANGAIVDKTADGKITRADMVVLGNSLPKYYGGLFTTLKLWQFTLDVVMDYALGFNYADLTSLCIDKQGSPMLLDSYVKKGDYARLSRASAAYDWAFPQESFLKGLRASIHYDACPLGCAVTAGVKLIF